MNNKHLDLNIDINKIKNYDDYKKIWNKIGQIDNPNLRRLNIL